MLLVQALKNKSISLLWIGQVLSSMGDELYRIAFIWIAVGLIGGESGYLAASQSAILLLVTLFGGKWADHWDPYRTLITSDLLRGFFVLIPVIASLFFPMSLSLLWISSLLISGVSGFFDPALQTVLPRYCKDRQTLQAANGLMSTTFRLARVGAPLLMGALTALIPVVHFFSLDGLSFFLSASTILLLMKHPIARPHSAPGLERQGIWKSLVAAIQLLAQKPKVLRALYVKAILGGAWQMCYGVGLALSVRNYFSSNLGAFGAVMGAYGVGNLAAAIWFGNRERKNPEPLVYLGFIVIGVGFIWIGLSTHLIPLCLASAFCAIGGPVNDTAFTDFVQAEFEVHELTKIFRLRTAAETGCALVAMVISPFLFRVSSVSSVITGIGILTLTLSIYGRLHIGLRVNLKPE